MTTYRYGFNGQEKSNEIKGEGNSYTAEFWEYDPRSGRRWNRDPVPHVSLSDYNAFNNNPIFNVDPNGALFFGLFGSSSAQRQSAKSFAQESGGSVKNKWKRDIHVNYTTITTETNNATATNRNAYFLDDGRATTKSYRDLYNSGAPIGEMFDYWDNKKMFLASPGARDVPYIDGLGQLGIEPARSQVIERPAIDPIDIAAGGIYGLFKSMAKSGATAASESVLSSEASSVLSQSDLLRIENAATRINKPITVVGSRANGTAGAYSDWDYVIPGLNNAGWKKIKNSLPGSKSVLDNVPRNIDVFKGPINPNLPNITITPR